MPNENYCSGCDKALPSTARVLKSSAEFKGHDKCNGTVMSRVVPSKAKQQEAATATAMAKAANRKQLTGRDHQGNHDSLTKPEVRGGPKGDRHANGIRQAGTAGQKDG